MLVNLRAGLQAHADAAGEAVTIDYHLSAGRPIRMSFRPAAGAESPGAPAAKSHATATPPQATPAVPPPAKTGKPLTRRERRALNTDVLGVMVAVLRSLPEEDIAEHLKHFPGDSKFLTPTP